MRACRDSCFANENGDTGNLMLDGAEEYFQIRTKSKSTEL